MPEHECIDTDILHRTCRCYILGLEPAGNCPIHGGGTWPPQCGICGRFMPWEIAIQQRQERHALP